MNQKKYNNFIEQRCFENDLKSMFNEVNVDENKKIVTEDKKKIIKEKTEIPPVKYPKPNEKIENPPKDFEVTPMIKNAEKFIPNNLGKKDIGIDINELAVALKSDPNFMSKMQPRQGLNVGSGLGHKETQQLIDASIEAIPTASATIPDNIEVHTTLFNPGVTSGGNPAWREGLVFYDYDNKTLALYNDQSDVTLQIGQEGHIRVLNGTGSTILNGQAVQITSGVGGIPIIGLAVASYSANNQPIAIATHNIPADAVGLTTLYGTVSDVNLSAFTNGDTLYLSPTIPGAYTNVAPNTPCSTIEIGHVIDNGVNGKLLVKIDKQPLTTPDLEIKYVSVSGTDSSAVDGTQFKPYKTIGFALSQITNNSDLHRYVILVNPGRHVETNNPIQMKSFVDIKAIAGQQTTRIIAGNSDDLFIGEQIASIDGMSLEGADGYNCINMNTSGSLLINDISFINSNGISVTNPDASVNIDGLALLTFGSYTMDYGVTVSGGNVIVRNVDITPTTKIKDVVKITEPNSIVTIKDIISFSPNVSACINMSTSARCVVNDINILGSVYGFKLEDGVNLRIDNGVIFNCQKDALYVSSAGEGSLIGTNAVTLQDSVGLDLNVMNSATTLFGSGYLEANKTYVDEGSKIYGSFIDLFMGDDGLNVLGELHVGTSRKPAESVFGEGDSYTGNMIVYTYDGTTSAINDVSVSAKSYSGSMWGFSNNSVDSAIYCASTVIRDGYHIFHYGIKADILSAHDGTGNIIAEYYTSAGTWKEIKTLSTDSTDSYYPHANKLFEHTKSQQIRYDNLVRNVDLGKTDPVGYGTDLYWVRFRITSITNIAPVFEQFKLHSSRYEINSDGWVEYFGRARPISRFPWDIGVLEKAATAPGDQDLYLGDTLDVGGKKNRLRTGQNDRIGFKTTLPFDCDTSTSVIFDWSCIVATGGGDLDWVIRWGFNGDGDKVYRAAPGSDPANMQTYTVTELAPATADTVKWYRTSLDISEMVSRREGGVGDTIWLTIQRTGTADTNGSDASLVAISANYTKWCDGGHIGL